MKLNAVLNAETGKLEEYRTLLKGVDKIIWERGCSKEVARLAQGRKDGSVKGTETLHFIDADQERYLLTFASVPTTVPKKKILIAFDGPSVARLPSRNLHSHRRPSKDALQQCCLNPRCHFLLS